METYSTELKRHAHIYVFCLFPKERAHFTREILNLDNWAFFICTTAQLDVAVSPTQKTIGLRKVEAICGSAVGYEALKGRIDGIVESSTDQ